jgi:hypothetical protein
MHSRQAYIRREEYHSPLRHSSPVRAHEFVGTLSPSRRYSYIAPPARDFPRYVPSYHPYRHSPVKELYARRHYSPVKPVVHVPTHYTPSRTPLYNPYHYATSYEDARSRPLTSGYRPKTPEREPEHKVENEVLESL